MIKLKDLIIETWNSNIWPSNIWKSDIWNSDIWPSHVWEGSLPESKKNYQHNCVHKNDNYSNSIFSDASDMAYAIESSDPIDVNEFTNNVNTESIPRLLKLRLRKNPNEIKYGKFKNLIWAHDLIDDIHYFFI